MNRVSLNDCINVMQPKPETEHVIVALVDHWQGKSNFALGVQSAIDNGLLVHQCDEFYKCKKVVATNLDLLIIKQC